MYNLSFKNFNLIYQQTLIDVFKFWNYNMQTEIAKHNFGWCPGNADFYEYLKFSAKRFYLAYRFISSFKSDIKKICDLGGLWGTFAITMQKIGYDVTMTETLRFYSDSFAPLFCHIRECGVEIIDYDPFDEHSKIHAQFDFISIMALIEHYPHTLKYFFINIKKILKYNGKIYIEVPNIAYWPKRIKFFLLGTSPLININEIYLSEIPFIGHHHEYTLSELVELSKLNDFEILDSLYYNYSPDKLPPKPKIINYLSLLIKKTITKLFPSNREAIGILLKYK